MSFYIDISRGERVYSKIANDKFKVKMDNSYIFCDNIFSEEPRIRVDIVSDVISGNKLKDVTIGFMANGIFNTIESDYFFVYSIDTCTFSSYREKYLDLYLVFDTEKDYLKWKLKS